MAPASEQGLQDPTRPILDGFAGGAASSVVQTADFLTGNDPSGQPKSDFRKSIEAKPGDGLGYGLTHGVAEFGVGLLGAGKLLAAARGVKAVGGAIEAVEAARGGSAALEAAKAAAVGAIAFDPHTERLSNLIEASPALSNPVSQFLAAREGDSAAAGRMKNALESLGMDAALIGVIGATVKSYKAFGAWKNGEGTAEDAIKASQEVGAAMDQHNAIRDKTEAQAAPAAPQVDENGAPVMTVTPRDKPADVPADQPATTATPEATAAGDPSAAPPEPPSAPETHTDLSGRTFTKDSPEQPWVAKPPEPAAPSPEVSQVKSPTSGAGAEGLPPNFKPSTVLPEEARSIYEGATSDMEAFEKFGSWDAAVSNGHIFGKGGSIPYQKLAGGEAGKTELDAFVSNAAEQLKTSFDAAKGGDVLSDARVQNLVQQRYKLYGEDPAALMGLIQRAGKDANSLVANMEASYGVAQRGYQDAYALAARIKSGDLTGFDNMEGAMEGLRQRLEVASSAWSSGQAMRAASGRALRRMRSEFRLQPADVDALKGIDDHALVELLSTTGGDSRVLKFATRPAILHEVRDWAQFLYTNNLLWSLRTHFINFSTNFYMVAARPMERILGSLAQSGYAALKGDAGDLAEAARQTRRESLGAYTYMGSTLADSWKSALEAFKAGDSLLAPHGNELANGVDAHGDIGRQVAQLAWKPWDSIGNVTANALMVAAPKAVGLPSRTIGTVDEFIKGISYRSNVMAKAHVDGVSQGLTGDALSGFVKDRLYDSFDDAGRAVDQRALQEARIATFQQDLLTGTLGSGIQSAVASSPWLRFIVPFVRTPTNVMRYGVKLTPGLNYLQTEYRDMIRGVHGPEQQAQAIGQMAMGSLFMGLAAYLHHIGAITGGGPSDPRLKAALRATGWQPYSFVKTNADGSLTYVPYGRFDPVAMPLGMVADIGDVLHASPDSRAVNEAGNMMTAVLLSLTKSFAEKSYMKSVDDALQFALEPDHNAIRYAGRLTANFVPGASLLRQINPDPDLKDARTYLDYVRAGIPGFSDAVPAKRDAFGDPVTAHKGLWINAPSDIVDSELRRMAEKPGSDGDALGPPSSKFKGGIDLRDITMVNGQNAYDHYQELARKPTPAATPIKDVVVRLMQTDAYKNAPDGDPKTKGTKMAIITNPMAKYRAAADRLMMADKNVRDAAYKKQMAAASAYANRKANQSPTPQNAQSNALGALQGAFGSLAGSTHH